MLEGRPALVQMKYHTRRSLPCFHNFRKITTFGVERGMC